MMHALLLLYQIFLRLSITLFLLFQKIISQFTKLSSLGRNVFIRVYTPKKLCYNKNAESSSAVENPRKEGNQHEDFRSRQTNERL